MSKETITLELPQVLVSKGTMKSTDGDQVELTFKFDLSTFTKDQILMYIADRAKVHTRHSVFSKTLRIEDGVDASGKTKYKNRTIPLYSTEYLESHPVIEVSYDDLYSSEPRTKDPTAKAKKAISQVTDEDALQAIIDDAKERLAQMNVNSKAS